jgi:TonB family protein
MSRFHIQTILLLYAALHLSSSDATSGQVERRVTRAIAPPYDDILVQARLQGTAKIRVQVKPSGEVEDAEIVESLWDLRDELYKQYARKWRFEAHPTSTTEEIVFIFRFIPRDSPPEDVGTVFTFPATVEIRSLEPPPSYLNSTEK